MNRWTALTNRIAIATVLSGAVALGTAGMAWAQSDAANGASAATPSGGHRHGHGGLLQMAQGLGSLSATQRTTLQQIAQTQHSAMAPVRQADAIVLTTLAQEVEAGAIDRQALASSVHARETAGLSVQGAHRDAVQKLHDALTPDQRSQLVDAIESGAHAHGWHGAMHGGDGGAGGGRLAAFGNRLGLTQAQEDRIRANFRSERAAEGPPANGTGGTGAHAGAGKAWLESFRSDTFQASAMSSDDVAHAQAALDRRADRLEDWMQAAVPVLTPAQRSTLAEHLRERAKRESGA